MEKKTKSTSTKRSPSRTTKTEAPLKLKSTAGAAGGPSHEEIAQHAYELFLARGGAHGYHEQDWFQAELDLGARR